MKKNIALVILIIVALVMFGCSSDEKNYVENNPDTTRDGSNAWLAGLVTRVPVLFGVGDELGPTGQVRSKGGAVCTQLLDSVPEGSISTWTVQNTGGNPVFSYYETTSPYDGSKAIQTSANGNSYITCETKYIEKKYTVSGNALTSDLKAYLAFTSTFDSYVFPSVMIVLYDEYDNGLASHVYYGKDVITGIYIDIVANDPGYYTGLQSAAGYQTLDLSPMGNVNFAKIGIRLQNYACYGQNSVTFDHLSIESNCAGGSSRSSLYWINTVTGSATMIGDIGYRVNGIAYDAITNKLYGITSGIYATPLVKQGGGSELIEIDMATGEGSLIGTITPNKEHPYYDFSQPSFNSLGTLYAVNNRDHQMCTINVTTAEANCFDVSGDSHIGVGPEVRGQAFNNIDVLNLIVPGVSALGAYKDDDDLVTDDDDDSSGGARIYTFDMANKKFNYQRTVYGLPYNMAPNGDFDPSTGLYWGLDSLKYFGDDDDDSFASDDDDDFATKHLLMISAEGGKLIGKIPTNNNLHAITFGYLDAITLIKMGLNDLINFLCPDSEE